MLNVYNGLYLYIHGRFAGQARGKPSKVCAQMNRVNLSHCGICCNMWRNRIIYGSFCNCEQTLTSNLFNAKKHTSRLCNFAKCVRIFTFLGSIFCQKAVNSLWKPRPAHICTLMRSCTRVGCQIVKLLHDSDITVSTTHTCIRACRSLEQQLNASTNTLNVGRGPRKSRID